MTSLATSLVVAFGRVAKRVVSRAQPLTRGVAGWLGLLVTSPVAALTLQNGRNTLVTMANGARGHRTYWDYNQRRPVQYRLRPRFEYDCSGGVCWLYWTAGLRDPSGRTFTGSDTDTLTLLKHGRRIAPSEVLHGDVCVLGAELPVAEQHAIMALEAGPNPLSFSHGQQGDPSFIRPSEDGRSKTWLSFDVRRVHRIRWPKV